MTVHCSVSLIPDGKSLPLTCKLIFKELLEARIFFFRPGCFVFSGIQAQETAERKSAASLLRLQSAWIFCDNDTVSVPASAAAGISQTSAYRISPAVYTFCHRLSSDKMFIAFFPCYFLFQSTLLRNYRFIDI